MKKFFLIFIVFSLFVFAGCGSDKKEDEKETGKKTDTESADKTDSGTSDKTDTDSSDSGSTDKPDSGDSSDTASETKSFDFDKSCKASGGTPTDGICVCSKAICDVGVVCNFETKQCANAGEAGSDCTVDTPSTCTNSGIGIGIVKECQNGHKVNVSCQTVSCNEAGDACGECLNSQGTTCTNSPSFIGEVTECKNGKIVKKSCSTKSCNQGECGKCKNYEQFCENKLSDKGEEIGRILECQEGKSGKQIADCVNVSCGTDLPACGECINNTTKCTEDNNNNAIMWRCADGKWKRLVNKYDPIDIENYKCPAECRIDALPEYKDIVCGEKIRLDPDLCLSCDPCVGVGDDDDIEHPETWSDYNPCHSNERCAQILAEEDPDYPPFRDYDTSLKLIERNAYTKATNTMKEVFGYNFNNHESVSDPSDREENFKLDLTNGRAHVSCNADKTYYGVCHNSLQICINEHYHTKGYIVQCANGALTDYDGKGDGIACHCESHGTSNAYGCCYTRSNCFKNSTAVAGHALCEKPGKEENDPNNYGY